MPKIPGWPGPVLRLTETESTQDLAKAMAQAGSPEWTLILAECQTKGRGRMARRWASPKGGLYFSLILRPQLSPRRLGELSLLTAKAVARALVSIPGLEAAVKPPNDVLVRRSQEPTLPFKKVCGILIEAASGSSVTEWLVIGVGINVNNRIPSHLLNAASLSGLCGREFDLHNLAIGVLSHLKTSYRAYGQTTSAPSIKRKPSVSETVLT
jgi:BirA family biotin operon repressor/biotin-[acetyl-CoA-carboxylase] ligase